MTKTPEEIASGFWKILQKEEKASNLTDDAIVLRLAAILSTYGDACRREERERAVKIAATYGGHDADYIGLAIADAIREGGKE